MKTVGLGHRLQLAQGVQFADALAHQILAIDIKSAIAGAQGRKAARRPSLRTSGSIR